MILVVLNLMMQEPLPAANKSTLYCYKLHPLCWLPGDGVWFRCASSSPVSPSTRTRPACECKKPQTPSSSFKYLSSPWSRMKVKSELLQRGHGFPAAFMASIHSWQIFCPQGQLMTQGSFSTCRQMGHSVWKAAARASTNSQSYPPRRLPPGGIGFGARTA